MIIRYLDPWGKSSRVQGFRGFRVLGVRGLEGLRVLGVWGFRV